MNNLDKILSSDIDGMSSYEYLVNNIDNVEENLEKVIDNIIKVDSSGQFVSSAARYLNATEPELYSEFIGKLLEAAIDKDRSRVYLPTLLSAIWGEDYLSRAEDLRKTDDNFRRIYKRVHPSGSI